VRVRTALLAGASGLVGGHLLDQLLVNPAWDRVVSIGRREVERVDPRLEQRAVQLPDVGELSRVDDVFCAVGTTIKKAGSQAAFRVVDHDFVVALAAAARAAGAESFLHVTAMGADPDSRLFYNRVKGETERDVAEVGIARTIAFRPSILDGERAESRPAEQAGLMMMRAVAPLLGRYRPTQAADVASAMVNAALDRGSDLTVLDAGAITRSARSA
jgi:uncharacterized protein YbjT (DUF2867 family)